MKYNKELLKEHAEKMQKQTEKYGFPTGPKKKPKNKKNRIENNKSVAI